jgi:hypothetical protein
MAFDMFVGAMGDEVEVFVVVMQWRQSTMS